MDLPTLISSNKVYLHRRLEQIFVKDVLTHETLAVYGVHGTKYVAYDKVEDTATGTIRWCNPLESVSVNDLVETNTVPYSEYVVSRLLERVAEGEALTKICKDAEMPSYSQLMRWMKLHPWIRQGLEEARLARAEFHRDRVMEESEKAESYKDPIQATQVRIDANKWLASMDDPRYKNNAKVEAHIAMPTQIVVQTGIQRDVTPTISSESIGVKGDGDEDKY